MARPSLAIIAILFTQNSFAMQGGKPASPSTSWYMDYSNCTSVQVAKRIIVTAAHCVKSIRSRKNFPPESLAYFPQNQSGADVTIHVDARVGDSLFLAKSKFWQTRPEAATQVVDPVVNAIHIHPSYESRLATAKSSEQIADDPAVSDVAAIVFETDLPGESAALAGPEMFSLDSNLFIGGFGPNFARDGDYHHASPAVLEENENYLVLGNKDKSCSRKECFQAIQGDSGGGTFLPEGEATNERKAKLLAISSVLQLRSGYDHYSLKVSRLDAPQVSAWLRNILQP